MTREFGRRGLEFAIVRPKTFIGPERLGVFEILFDWIRDDRRIYTLGNGENRYQLLAVEDLVDAIVLAAERPEAAGETVNVGAGSFGTVRADLQALIDHAGLVVAADACSRAPGGDRAAGARAAARLTARGVALQDGAPGLVRRDRAARSGCSAGRRGLSNAEALCRTYDWYLAHRDTLAAAGVTHRVPWNQQALALLKRIS